MASAASDLADMEMEDSNLQHSIADLDERSSRMLKREMQALGVMDPLDSEREVALAEPEFTWAGLPVIESIDWDAVLGSGDGTAERLSG